jgi:hypothetical protein
VRVLSIPVVVGAYSGWDTDNAAVARIVCRR